MTSLNPASIVDLSARFLGVLLRPDQSGYDEVRRVHNGMIDRRPALIAGCLGNLPSNGIPMSRRRISAAAVGPKAGDLCLVGRPSAAGGATERFNLIERGRISIAPQIRRPAGQKGVGAANRKRL